MWTLLKHRASTRDFPSFRRQMQPSPTDRLSRFRKRNLLVKPSPHVARNIAQKNDPSSGPSAESPHILGQEKQRVIGEEKQRAVPHSTGICEPQRTAPRRSAFAWSTDGFPVRSPFYLRPQMTQGGNSTRVQGREYRHQTVLRAKIANRPIAFDGNCLQLAWLRLLVDEMQCPLRSPQQPVF